MYENFKKILDKKKLTPYKVSKDTGISQATFSDWKNGRSTPKIDKLQKIADYLDIDVRLLISNESQALNGTPVPDELIVMAKKTSGLTKEQQKRIYDMLNKTIDFVLTLIE